MNSSTPPVRRLYRSVTDRMIAGVAAGLGDYLKVDPVWIRILFVALAVLSSGLFVLVYLAAWVLVPENPAETGTPTRLAGRLHRSAKERMIAGICGGLAETFKLDPVLIRLAAVAALVFTWGGAIFVYLIAWIVMPLQAESPLVLPPGDSQDADATTRPLE